MVDTAHLRLTHVTKRFGDAVAVDDVSFEVPRGSFATLLGPSGCGKTTTLRMIAGFYEPDAGDIELAGKRINNLPAHKRGAAMVFQDYALFPHMSVRANVGYGLRLQHKSRADIAKKVDETLKFVGLAGLGEDVRDAAPRGPLDHVVGVGERHRQDFREPAPRRALADAREADQDNFRCHGGAAVRPRSARRLR